VSGSHIVASSNQTVDKVESVLASTKYNVRDLHFPRHYSCFSGYLKMWQLASPHIQDYDVIILDEAQDCSECVRDIIEQQRSHTALVFVGDPHRQLYNSHYRTNALENVEYTHTYYLTQVSYCVERWLFYACWIVCLCGEAGKITLSKFLHIISDIFYTFFNITLFVIA